MNLTCERSQLRGSVVIPGSKSHTIRAVAIASLAEGDSRIERPLESEDARASIVAYRALGATIETDPDEWRVHGFGGAPKAPDNVIDVANSGTTMRIAMGSCSLLREGAAVLTGDGQIRRRPCGPVAKSLTDLGAKAWSTRGTGCPPMVVEGRIRGGETTLEAVSSQYLTSLLMAAPLADGDTTINVSLLNEGPYVEMTLDWLRRQGIVVEQEGTTPGKDLRYHVRGGQRYQPVNRPIPADWSTATFFIAAGALGNNAVRVQGLDLNDTQGDRAVLDYVRRLGARVVIDADGILVEGGDLIGCEFDLNATPDALPMMAVLGCFARGETRLVNVPQARLKETDRIAVMRQELQRLGANIEELPDGLIIKQSALQGGHVDGHADHRVVMSLAIAGTQLDAETTIHGAEAMAVTYPGFVDALTGLGGSARTVQSG
ncbi:MAG: 3-phosphoshikimate 1-carboxyvinyltransferase [Candidatus Hydrogenedentes bacterium]|nr:3-phosphoshikimate 1-carboxyvinyltransferase [Candidatus Hydrogenedentota bacterium]